MADMVIVNSGDHHFGRRSSSACAKCAEAFADLDALTQHEGVLRSSAKVRVSRITGDTDPTFRFARPGTVLPSWMSLSFT